MKPWYQSKTLWFNVVTLILGVLGELRPFVPAGTWTLIMIGAMALGNGVLRIWFTDTAIQ